MIERLQGVVVASDERRVTVMVQGIGFAVQVPDPSLCAFNTTQLLYTYVHWSPEKGQSMFGFSDEISRHFFLLLIGCQKIGPTLALSLLRQRSAATLVQDIMTSNVAGLSSCQGIGVKKAEGIIHELKDKVTGLSALAAAVSPHAALVHQVQEALVGLGYTPPEIKEALLSVMSSASGDSALELNIVLRKALAFLSTRAR